MRNRFDSSTAEKKKKQGYMLPPQTTTLYAYKAPDCPEYPIKDSSSTRNKAVKDEAEAEGESVGEAAEDVWTG